MKYASAALLINLIAVFPQSAAADTASDRAAWIGAVTYNVSTTGRWEYLDYLRTMTSYMKDHPADTVPWVDREAIAYKERAEAINNGATAAETGSTFRVPEIERVRRFNEALGTLNPLTEWHKYRVQDDLRESARPQELDALIADTSTNSKSFFENAEQGFWRWSIQN